MQIDYKGRPLMNWLTPALQDEFNKLRLATTDNEKRIIMQDINKLRREARRNG